MKPILSVIISGSGGGAAPPQPVREPQTEGKARDDREEAPQDAHAKLLEMVEERHFARGARHHGSEPPSGAEVSQPVSGEIDFGSGRILLDEPLILGPGLGRG